MRHNPEKTKVIEPKAKAAANNPPAAQWHADGFVPPEEWRTPDQYAGEKVTIGVCAPAHMNTRFTACLLDLLRYERWGSEDCRIEQVRLHQPGARIAHGRNNLTRAFLQDDEAEWLIQLDYDLVFPPNLLDFWLSAADPVKRPLAQIIYYSRLNGQVIPFAYRDAPDKIGYHPFTPPAGTICWVDSVASGATAVHRTVYEKMEAEYDAEFAPYTWYGEFGTIDGREQTEDVVFSKRVQALGFGMVVDARHTLGHIKEQILGYDQ